jgi:hypothetical protein
LEKGDKRGIFVPALVSSPAYPAVFQPITTEREYAAREGASPLSKYFPLSFTLPQKERGTQGVRFKNLNFT